MKQKKDLIEIGIYWKRWSLFITQSFEDYYDTGVCIGPIIICINWKR